MEITESELNVLIEGTNINVRHRLSEVKSAIDRHASFPAIQVHMRAADEATNFHERLKEWAKTSQIVVAGNVPAITVKQSR